MRHNNFISNLAAMSRPVALGILVASCQGLAVADDPSEVVAGVQPEAIVETAMAGSLELAREERPMRISSEEAPTVEEQEAEEAIPFRPPLSLNECLELIDLILSHVPRAESSAESAQPVPAAALIRMIDSCYNYLNFRDDLHTSLAHYEWMRLGETRVGDPIEPPDRDILHFDAPVRNISALHLAVDRGDVFLHGIWVYDETGQERQQFLFDPPRRLRHSLPRMEVFHLWRRTEISRIELAYSRVEDMDRSPKVFVRGGITTRREYIKTALYNLKMEAEPAILQGRYADARAHLESARRNITDYIRMNRRNP